MANKVLGNDTTKSVEMIRNAVHYIMGMNPLSFSFVSGHGEHSVQNIFSSIFTNHYDRSLGFEGYAVPPGFMAGGSNQYDAGFMSNWPSKSYVDSDKEWTTNEHAIYYQAGLVLLLTLEQATRDVVTNCKYVN
jgi:hypothetical protein